MKEVIILGNGKSARECPFDAEVWTSLSYDIEQFPVEDILTEFGITYFKPIESYMLAHAIYLGYEKIRVYGVDFESKKDFEADKPRIVFWIGVARGRGLEVEIGKKSKLYRVMKGNVKDRYDEAREFIRNAKSFSDIAKSGNDPYCFVTGVDLSAITVTSKTQSGEEVARWQGH